MKAVVTLFAGNVRPMPGDGRPTGIFKAPVNGCVRIGPEGLESDAQADRRVHGGPEKAVHQLPLENHQRLAQRFPELAAGFVAGGLGENISTAGMDENDVCIGDVFALGSVRLQLNQPRSPCWKIDARHGREGIAQYVAEQGIAGWYFRVLEPGLTQSGDELRLLERNPEPVSLRELWQLQAQTRPDLARLELLTNSPGLNPGWRQRLQQRVDWLRRNPA